MTNILLTVLILIVVANIILTLKRKVNIDVKPQLRDLEDQFTKFETLLERTNKDIKEDFRTNRTEINDQAKKNREEQSSTLNSFKDDQSKTIISFKDEFKTNTKELADLLENNFIKLSRQNTDANKDSELRLKEIKESIEKHLNHLREDNSKQINEMRKTVDEKLQSTLAVCRT